MTEPTVDGVVKAYITLRRQKEVIETDTKERLIGNKEKMLKLEAWLTGELHSRALEIKLEKIEELAVRRDTRRTFLERGFRANLKALMLDRKVAGGLKGLKSGTKLNDEVLDSFTLKQCSQIVVASDRVMKDFELLKSQFEADFTKVNERFENEVEKVQRGDDLSPGIEGRSAIVCASSQGLGNACALALAAEGVNVIINGRDAEKLSATAEEIRKLTKVEVTPVAADINTESGRETLLSACDSPDILINNNAGPPPGVFEEWSHEDWIGGIEANMIIEIGPASTLSSCDGCVTIVDLISLPITISSL